MTKVKPGDQCCDDRPDPLRDEIKASLEATTGPANPDSQRYRGVVMSATDVAPGENHHIRRTNDTVVERLSIMIEPTVGRRPAAE